MNHAQNALRVIPALVILAACGPSTGRDANLNGTGPTGPVGVAVVPPNAVVVAGKTFQFAANVTGTAATGVTWTVTEASGGTVSAGGLYQAPSTGTGPFHVVATSTADRGKSGQAVVTVASATTSGKTSWVWIGNTGLYPWGCSAAAGCTGSETSTTAGSSFYAGILAHKSSFTHVSIALYTLNYCNSPTCTCGTGTCHTGTSGIAYQSGVPWLISCNVSPGTQMCSSNGPNVYDGAQATRGNLVATYHGLGLKVSALIYAGASNFGTDKGAAAIMCGGSTAPGQSSVDPTLANVCSAQRNFIQAMVSEAATYGYDDINLDWELGDGGNGSDANLGAAPTYPKINGSYAQAFSNFITNFKSALKAAGLATTISIPAIPSNVNGSNCSGGNTGGYVDGAVLQAPGGALANGSLDYVMIQAYNSNLVTSGTPAAGYPPKSCGTAPTWGNNFYGSYVLNSSAAAACDDSLTGYALMMCPPNWGSSLNIDASHVVIGMDAGQNSSNRIAGQAMQVITDFGFRGIAIWPDYDGSAANASFMSAVGINTSGFTLGGSDWYQMLGNWLAAP